MYGVLYWSSGKPLSMEQSSSTKGSALLAVYWVQFVIVFIFVSARIYARCIIHALGWDDVFIVTAMVGAAFKVWSSSGQLVD